MSYSGRWAHVVGEVGGGPDGRLTVINARVAELGRWSPEVASVFVGCSPVRVITSNDGALVWVADRETDSVNAHLMLILLTGGKPNPAITVHVWLAHVGLAAVMKMETYWPSLIQTGSAEATVISSSLPSR